jgi:tetratricopeptide (TPR) repeat protein
MNTVTDITPLEQIESACGFYSSARDALRRALEAIRAQVNAITEAARPELLAALDEAANARTALESLVEAYPELFDRPRTRQMHGIKVGYRKLPGAVQIDDEARTIELIRKRLPAKADALIATIEKVRKEAVAQLDAREISAIGAILIATGDEVVIRAADTDIDRLLKGLTSDESIASELLARAAVV